MYVCVKTQTDEYAHVYVVAIGRQLKTLGVDSRDRNPDSART
jgi:hypothetical protein